jgi:hypothetical protein
MSSGKVEASIANIVNDLPAVSWQQIIYEAITNAIQAKATEIKINFLHNDTTLDIGKAIHQKQEREGWGAKIIKQLSRDLRNDFPKEKGFSERNIMFMLRFYKEYQDIEIVKLPVSQLRRQVK